MKGGHTEVMRTLRKRHAQGSVRGLYDVREQALHEFDDCIIAGHRKAILTIGRARHCDIKLSDPTVSLVHCDVHRHPSGVCTIEDAGSTNGLFVNDIKVERAVLMPGMWIFLGRTELIAVGPDRSIPITATTNTSFLNKAAVYYGSDRKAAAHVGKSAATIRRARHRWRRRGAVGSHEREEP